MHQEKSLRKKKLVGLLQFMKSNIKIKLLHGELVGIKDVKDALNSFGGDELSVDDRSVKEGSNGDAGQGPINVQCHNMPSKRFAVFPVRQTIRCPRRGGGPDDHGGHKKG